MPRANKNVIIASEDTCQEMNLLTVIMKKSTGWPPLKIVSPHRTQSESFDTEHWNTGMSTKHIVFCLWVCSVQKEGYSHCNVSFPYGVSRGIRTLSRKAVP